MLHDATFELGDDPGLAKDGVEAELQELLAKRVAALRDDLRLVRREYPTDIGPVDLLCRDADDRAVVIEVKRVGEIAGVEQLLRYQERLDLDPSLTPTIGMFVATRIKPQAKVFAASRGVRVRGDRPRGAARRARRSTSACSDGDAAEAWPEAGTPQRNRPDVMEMQRRRGRRPGRRSGIDRA